MTDDIAESIEAIPRDLPRIELPDRLEPIIEKMAVLDPPRAEACLTKIQFWFGLRKPEIEAYRRMLRQKQKALESEAPSAGPKPVLTAEFPGLVDLAIADGKTVFIIRDGEDLLIEEAYELDGNRYVPPPKEQIPWLLPRGQEVMRWFRRDSDTQLYEDLLRHHRSISELPSEPHYDLLVAWVLHTYFLEDVWYSPILWLHAVPERGKSRTGKGVIYVARRGVHVESLREAYLLRVAQDLKATLFIDVMDLNRKLERSGSEDIVLLRFEKGAKVPRVLYPEKGPFQDMVYYEVFGPTVIGTNEPIHHILETRSIPIIQHQSHRRFETEVTPEAGRVLRERSVALRARHLATGLPEMAKPMPGRLGDILKPLLQVATLIHPGRVSVLTDLFQELQASRLTQRADSLDAQILLAVEYCGREASDGLVPVGDVADHINKDREQKDRLSPQKVGRRLVALGFEKTRTGRNYAAMVWDPERLARAMASYGLQEPPETPQTPGSLSYNELRTGVSPNESPSTNGGSGVSPEKLQPVRQRHSMGLEDAGVSGVSRRFSDELSHTQGGSTPGRFDQDNFEERAAILEHDGGLTREEAEARALAEQNGDLR